MFLFTALSLHCHLLVFSSCSDGGHSLAVMYGHLIAVGFCCRARLYTGFVILSSWCGDMVLVAPRHVELSQSKDGTHIPCITGRFLTTRPQGVSNLYLFKIYYNVYVGLSLDLLFCSM